MKKTGIKPGYVLVVAIFVSLLAMIMHAASERHTFSERAFRVPPHIHLQSVKLTSDDGSSVLLTNMGEEDDWMVNGAFPARTDAMDELLFVLEHMEVVRPVSKKELKEQEALFDAQAVQIEVTARTYWIRLPFGPGLFRGNKTIRRMLLGRDTSGGDASYIKAWSSGNIYVVNLPGYPGGLGRVFRPWPGHWQSKTMLHLQPAQISAITATFFEESRGEQESRVNEARSYAISRMPDSGFQLMRHDGSEVLLQDINLSRLNHFLMSFTDVDYEALVAVNAQDPLPDDMAELPFLELSVGQVSGTESVFRFFHMKRTEADPWSEARFDPNRLYVQLPGGSIAAARFFDINRLLRPLSYFLEP